MTKLINKDNGAVVGEIITNHSMTIGEAIECLGGYSVDDMDDPEFSNDGDNIIIDGKRYWLELLDFE